MATQPIVLIVEDEKIIALDLQLRLTELDYHVFGSVPTGEEALALAQKHRFDLILMDIHLAGEMDGTQAATLIRAQKDIPIIFVTAFGDDSSFNKASDAEPYAYILKPFSDQELKYALRTALMQHELRKKLSDSEARYRSLFEQSRQALLILDDHAQVLDVNTASQELFALLGISEKNHAGWNLIDLFPADDRLVYLDRWQRFVRKGKIRGKFAMHDRYDRRIYLEYQIESGKQKNLHTCHLRNITSIVETRQEASYLAAIQRESPMPAFRVKTDGHIIFANMAGQALAKQWESDSPDLLPDSISKYLNRLHPSHLQENFSFRVKGKIFAAKLYLVPEQSQANLYFSDVTDIKQSERINNLHKDMLELVAKGVETRLIIDQMCTRLCTYIPEAEFALYIKDEQREWSGQKTGFQAEDLVFRSEIDEDFLKNWTGTPYHQYDSPLSYAAAERGQYFVSQVNEDLHTPAGILLHRHGFRSCLQVPALDENRKVVAILSVFFMNVEAPKSNYSNLLLTSTKVISLTLAKEKAYNSLYKQSLVFNNMNDAIILTNHDMMVRQWNPRAEKIFGIAAEEAIGKMVSTLPLFLKQQKLEKLLRYAMTAQQTDSNLKFTDEMAYVSPSGEQGFLDISVIRLKGDTEVPFYLLLVIRDITRQKKIEVALSTSEANLLALVENTDDIIFSLDTQLQFITHNKPCQALYQALSLGEVAPGTPFIRENMPEAASRLTRYFEQAMQGEHIQAEAPIPIGKEMLYFEMAVHPIMTLETRITGVSVFARNITKRRETETELRKTNFELDSFVYRASHDLRAPLRSVLGLTGIIDIEQDAAQRTQYLRLVEKSINKLDKFIADLTNFSRNTRLAVKVEPVDLAKILHDNLEDLKYMEGASELHASLIDTASPVFYADQARLNIIFQNVLSNAIKYRKRDTYSKLDILVERHTDKVFIVFSDNGKGISADYLPKVFDMFFRASEDSYGSGLGLYITRQVIERLGGQITVSSELGVGTSFHIVLPNMEQQYQQPVKPSNPMEELAGDMESDGFLLR